VNGLPDKHVVTSFLERRGLILLLKRSDRVGSFRGYWAGVSGYVEAEPDQQSLTEIFEETGLSAGELTLLKKGPELTLDDPDNGVRWVVHPYYYHVDPRADIAIDWEHTATCWIRPEQIEEYDTVPLLKEALRCVLP
jgi:8-oxo-dGTP diphosphatase